MKIYCIQFDVAWEDKAANLRKAASLLSQTKFEPGSLLVFPEMFSTGFSMNVAGLSEREDGPTSKFLAKTAREREVYAIGGVMLAGPEGKGSNEAACYGPDGRCIGRYRKMRPFTPGGESDHFIAGQLLTVFTWRNFKVAPFICYDLRFPELFRLAATDGAQIFVVLANWPSQRVHHWLTLLQARAIENQAYVAGTNRCGSDPHTAYPGRSVIVDPRGAILADAGPGEGIVNAEVSIEAVLDWRSEFPALRDLKSHLD